MSQSTYMIKRAVRNGGFFSFIIATIGLYQGETFISAAMVLVFAWIIIGAGLWLSYRLTEWLTKPKN
ncbi:hypothetical protein JCM30760_12250 [Thiomicrorhabdus hydrogeniphila]